MKTTLSCLLLLLAYAGVFAQSDSIALSSAVKRYQDILKNHPSERVYINLDKPFYTIGDTINFKAYVVIGEQHFSSRLSGVLYVDLINPDNSIYKSIKLQPEKGVAWADFAIPTDLLPGYYKIRAYTNWMLNDGLSVPFTIFPIQARLAVSGSFNEGVISGATTLEDLKFFPEGGSLVAGLETKIAFKATDANGLGEAVQGKILDDKNSIITTFVSSHAGLGFFKLKPEKGKIYHAIATSKNGVNKSFALPAALQNGLVMQVNSDSSKKVMISIEANNAYYQENQDKSVNLIITSGGLVYRITGKLTAPQIQFEIRTTGFTKGIMQLALLDHQNNLIAERLLFIQHPPDEDLTVDFTHTTTAASGQTQVNLALANSNNADDQVYLSASVLNLDIYAVKEALQPNILSNLLLTSNIEGFVEQPNYYFSKTDPKTQQDLDNLLITSEYKRFTWKKFTEGKYPITLFLPEKNLKLSGIVKTKNGKIAANQVITLSDPDGQGQPVSQRTDSSGRFVFKNLIYQNTANFNLKTENTSLTIIPQDDLPNLTLDSILLKSSIAELKASDADLRKNHQINKSFTAPERPFSPSATRTFVHLKEVKIKASKEDNGYTTNSLVGAGNADQVIHMDQLKGGGRPSDQLNGRLNGVKFMGSSGVPYLTTATMSGMKGITPMLIVVDGSIIRGYPGHFADINDLNLSDIETVEILKYGNAGIYGMEGANGVIIITTRQRQVDNLKDDTGVFHYQQVGFYQSKKELSATAADGKSSSIIINSNGSDFWFPNLQLTNRTTRSFDFANQNKAENLIITLEGIDDKGNLNRKSIPYNSGN